jgi:predicted PurR-regulated permease PerM
MTLPDPPFTRKAAIAATVGIVVILVAGIAVFAREVLLLLFAAILLAVFLRALSGVATRYLRLPEGWALLVVVLVLAGIMAGGVTLLVPRVSSELEELGPKLSESIDAIQQELRQRAWGRRLLRDADGLNQGDGGLLAGAGSALNLSIQSLAITLIVLFAGLYLAVNPRLYVHGLIRAVPRASRARASEVIEAVGETLKWFLIGRTVSMLAVGVLTGVGLALLGVPLPILLGVIAGLLTFVPYVGPIAASIPILLVAALQSPSLALYALIFYTGVQSVEGFVITPLVQERVVALPPAVTIVAEVLMGVLFGALGVVIAVPAAAAGLVLVRMLYVESALGDYGEERTSEEA